MTPGVVKTELPSGSILRGRVAPADFLDCYAVASTLSPRKAAHVIVDFPGWARLLLVIRNLLMAPLGLSSEGPPATDKIGFFPVELDTPDELIAGFDDKHLDFRVAVISRGGRVYLATWVHPHNIGGRFYLASILPFHILVSRDALKRVGNARAIEPSQR